MKKYDEICKVPFGFIEIFGNGDVYTCCSSYIKDGCLGNIFKDKFENIINSEKALKIRHNVLNKNYSMCNLKLCSPNTMPFAHQLNSKYTNLEYKEYISKVSVIKFTYDFDCNVKCKSCRDNIYRNSVDRIKELDEMAQKYFLPILKYTDKVCLIGSGDPLSSKHTRNFINMIVKEYPNIKFDLHTNGLLLNEQILNSLNIIDKLSVIQISIHSASKEVYDKIVLNGNYDTLRNNLMFVSKLKNSNVLEDYHINFVVSKTNIKDAKKFVSLGKEIGAKCFFWTLRDFGTDYCKNEIPSNYKLHKIFKSKLFDNKMVNLNPHLNYVHQKQFLEKYLIKKINNINKKYNYLDSKIKSELNKLYEVNEKLLLESNIFHFFGISKNSKYLRIIIFGIKITLNINDNLINKIAWWIPIKRLRNNFRYKLKINDQTRPDQTRPDQTRPDQTRPNM